jgi:hypothetical protein
VEAMIGIAKLRHSFDAVVASRHDAYAAQVSDMAIGPPPSKRSASVSCVIAVTPDKDAKSALRFPEAAGATDTGRSIGAH